MIPPRKKQSWDELTRLWQPADLSSHWTTALTSRTFAALLLLVFGVQMVLCGWLPLSAEEITYWEWSRELQKGYSSAPPMVAWAIRLSTQIFGDSAWGIRFFGPVAALIVLSLLGSITPRKFVLHLTIFSPLVLFASIFMSPTAPLIVFWAAYLLWLRHCCVGLSHWEADPISRVYSKSPLSVSQWILGGSLLGLGILSQYTMLLAGACSLLLFLTKYRRQAWLPGYILHWLVALGVSLPLWLFNVENNFVPLWVQWQTLVAFEGFSISRLGTLLTNHLFLIGAAPLIFFPWAVLRASLREGEAQYRPYFYLYLFPFTFYAFRSLYSQIPLQSVVIVFLAFLPLSQRLIDGSNFPRISRLLTLACFFPALFGSSLFVLQYLLGWQWIPANRDVIGRLKAESEITLRLSEKVKTLGSPVFASNPWDSRLRYHKTDALSFDQPEAISLPCDFAAIYVITHTETPSAIKECFSISETIASYPLRLGNDTLETIDLIRFEK